MTLEQTCALTPYDLNSEDRARCPRCGGNEFYWLGDGRHMCRKCRTKYTPAPRKRRLRQSTLRELADHFWMMTPIDRTALELKLNRKTVQRYFDIIRNSVYSHCHELADHACRYEDVNTFFVGDWRVSKNNPHLMDKVTIFGLAYSEFLIHLVFTRSQLTDWSGLNMPSIHARPLKDVNGSEDGIPHRLEVAGEFWSFARHRLSHYRGGILKRFPLYLREMEFRFNHRHDPFAAQLLLKFLKTGPK